MHWVAPSHPSSTVLELGWSRRQVALSCKFSILLWPEVGQIVGCSWSLLQVLSWGPVWSRCWVTLGSKVSTLLWARVGCKLGGSRSDWKHSLGAWCRGRAQESSWGCTHYEVLECWILELWVPVQVRMHNVGGLSGERSLQTSGNLWGGTVPLTAGKRLPAWVQGRIRGQSGCWCGCTPLLHWLRLSRSP